MSTLLESRTSFLDGIISPADLKSLPKSVLQTLCQEIRQEIIESVSRTGGHLASNLGIVEITCALHYVFDSPSDKIVWDVGHQAYVHKMLTGRRHRFNSLRQFKGLSGFVTPVESEHDSFIAGHSSTAASLAVGMAIARDHFEQDHKVIAVIGDGGLTGGMALEAINHLGHIQRNVLIILNDNEMSISENLGGLSQYMKRIKQTFFYNDIKQKIDEIEIQLDGMKLRPAVRELITAVKRKAKERFDTPGIVFEKLGINYSGPVDGHDVVAIIRALENLKYEESPQILHLVTQKGKGYAPAEQDAIKYHGVSAFSLEKLEPAVPVKPKAKTYSEAFTDALIEIAEIEPRLVAITPATAEGSGLVKFGKIFPDRFFDVAICEQHAVTMAAGMAKAGLIPVVSIYSTFLQRAIDQVIHDVSILNLPVIFAIDRGGLVEDGETHQGVFDIAYLRTIPNFTVVAPANTKELRDMIFTAVAEQNGPFALRFPRDKAVNWQERLPFEKIDYRRWQTVQPGNGVTILAYGAMVEAARKALPAINERGLYPELVNARSCKPLDELFLKDLLNDPTRKIITLEEGCQFGGFGSAVLEFAARERMNNPGTRQAETFIAGITDNFVEHGARNILLDLSGLSPERIASLVLRIGQQQA